MKTHYCLFMLLSGVFIVNVFSELTLSDVATDFIKHRNPIARLSCPSPKVLNKSLVAFEYECNGINGQLLLHHDISSGRIGIVFYSDNALNVSSEMPPQLASLITDINQQLVNTPGTESNVVLTTLSKQKVITAFDSVAPLIVTKWHQNWPYNSLCPDDNNIQEPKYHKHTPAGCAAISMAQIMRFHRYPQQGTGTNTFSDTYGKHTVDFSHALYKWDNMPESLTESSSEKEISDVATLIYHCGVAIETEYGPDASGASFDSVKNAFEKYFNYSPSIRQREHYPFETLNEWKDALKTELNYKRPIYFMANGTIGHGFIIDGYKYIENSFFFHVNWGWGGNYDGYFNIDYLTVGSYTLDQRHQAYICIAPPSLVAPSNVRLIMNPYPPMAAWDPIPKAVGYFFEYHMNQTMSLGPLMEGPDSTMTDLRLVYNIPANDTLYFKVCSIDSTGCYSNWSYLNVINDGKNITSLGRDVNKPKFGCEDIRIIQQNQGYLVSLPQTMVNRGIPTLTLFSGRGQKIASGKILTGTTYTINPENCNSHITPGLYILNIDIAGERTFGKTLALTK